MGHQCGAKRSPRYSPPASSGRCRDASGEHHLKGSLSRSRGSDALEHNAVGKREFPRNKKPAKGQALKFAKDTIIPSVQSQINGVRALGAPAGDKAKVSAIVNAAQSALDKAKKNPIVLTQNGPDPFKKANQLSKAYGLTVCGSGGG